MSRFVPITLSDVLCRRRQQLAAKRRRRVEHEQPVAWVAAYACAHCNQARHVWTPIDLDGDLERAAASLAAHAVCTRPARLPVLWALGA